MAPIQIDDQQISLVSKSLGIFVVTGTWIWRAAKTHGRLAAIEAELKELKGHQYITVTTHDRMEALCQAQMKNNFTERLAGIENALARIEERMK